MVNGKSQPSFESLTDAELASEVRNGNDAAFEEITSRYKGLVSTIAAKYSAAGFDRADFMQEGLLALLCACKAYDNRENKASFKNFAGVCISNRFLSVIRVLNSRRAIPTDHIVNIEDLEISDQNRSNPETLMVEQEKAQALRNLIRDTLSPLEMDVLRLYLSGLAYTKIAQKLSISPKSVDNALQRIRKKLGKAVTHNKDICPIAAVPPKG